MGSIPVGPVTEWDTLRPRPSSSDRWLRCPETLHHRDDETSDAAIEGTFLHAEAERAVGECLDGVLPIPGAKPTHDDEAVQFAIDRVWNKVTPGTRALLEFPVLMRAGAEIIQGTADVVLLHPIRVDGETGELQSSISLMDYKFGVGIRVDADCDQMRIYAHGLLDMFGSFGYDRVVCSIIQPRHHRGVWLDDAAVREDPDFRESVEAAVAAARRRDAAVAGDWCKYCPAKSGCDAWAQQGWEVFDGLGI